MSEPQFHGRDLTLALPGGCSQSVSQAFDRARKRVYTAIWSADGDGKGQNGLRKPESGQVPEAKSKE